MILLGIVLCAAGVLLDGTAVALYCRLHMRIKREYPGESMNGDSLWNKIRDTNAVLSKRLKTATGLFILGAAFALSSCVIFLFLHSAAR